MQATTSPTPSDTSSFTNFTEIEEGDSFDTLTVMSTQGQLSPELPTELLVLDSLIPVVKNLPGLIIEKNGYCYVHGKIEPSNLGPLYNYAENIGELTLDAEPDSSGCRLAPQVLARIAQLQDPNKPLFPFLHCLRIVATPSSLHFLDLLLSSALTTLELKAIPVDDPCYSSVLSFLECATHQAPNLSTLILGPGRIQDQILDVSSRYKNLQSLKLLDVGISITEQLLQNIGSLQALEHLVLRDNGTSTYTRSPAIANPDEPIVDSSLFSALRTFEVDGSFDLIGDLVAKVSSSHLRALSIDITKPLERIPPVSVETIYSENDGFESPFDFPFGKKKRKKSSSLTSSLLSPPPPPPPPPLSAPQISTTDIMTLLRASTQKWPKTLISVRFKNDSIIPFSLPSDVFEDILLRPDMKHLEITGMDIDSMDGVLHRLKGVERSKLELLHLPPAPAISPARLREIAEAFSQLKSLRCQLRIRDQSDMTVSSPLSHQLEVLSVSNEGKLEQNQLLGIARYLDSTFPRLKSIKTNDKNGIEEWRSIWETVQAFQAVRMDEHRRLGLEPEGEVSKAMLVNEV